MIQVRKAEDRGHFDHGWLNTYHSFSFADYYDPEFMGFRDLRVINEDWVREGYGFPTHGHRDMEIITYVLDGQVEHKDSMGNGSIIRPGDVQRMSAGSGVRHSEYNPSKTEALHLLQIWIMPDREGGKPGYEQKNFSADEKRNTLRLVASPDGAEGSVTIQQDAKLYVTLIEPGKAVKVGLDQGRFGWIQVARGTVKVGPHTLKAGDGAAVAEEKLLTLESAGTETAEVLVFDLN